MSQPDKGYRITTDPFVFASHTNLDDITRVLDIGTGCGIIAMLLAKRSERLSIVGVEIQEELARYAIQNIKDNNLADRVSILNRDINDSDVTQLGGPFDLVVTNPPYMIKKSGRINSNPDKALARHEIKLNIDQVFACSKKLLKPAGKLSIIFPADRFSDLKSAMGSFKFYPVSTQWIYTQNRQKAKRIILTSSLDSKQKSTELPPIFL